MEDDRPPEADLATAEVSGGLDRSGSGRPHPRGGGPGPLIRRAQAFWTTNRQGLVVAAVGTVVLRLITEWIGLVSRFGVDSHAVARKPSLLSQVWGHWDTGYYLSIAQFGCTRDGWSATGKVAVRRRSAFAPLYPWGCASPMRSPRSTGSGRECRAVQRRLALRRPGRAPPAGLAPRWWRRRRGVGDDAALAFPTAFFLLAPYPESLALAFVALALVAARSERWMLAGVMAAGAAMTKYYLVIVVVALCVAVLQAHGRGAGTHTGGWRPVNRFGGLAKVVGPTVAVFVAWMVFQQIHLGNPIAFAQAQSAEWHRHIAAPWTLAIKTGSDLVHWRFLDTSVASVTELFDAVTVVLLAVATVVAYRRLDRSYGVLLGLGWCVFTFQTFLLGVTREALVLAPMSSCSGCGSPRAGGSSGSSSCCSSRAATSSSSASSPARSPADRPGRHARAQRVDARWPS